MSCSTDDATAMSSLVAFASLFRFRVCPIPWKSWWWNFVYLNRKVTIDSPTTKKIKEVTSFWCGKKSLHHPSSHPMRSCDALPRALTGGTHASPSASVGAILNSAPPPFSSHRHRPGSCSASSSLAGTIQRRHQRDRSRSPPPTSEHAAPLLALSPTGILSLLGCSWSWRLGVLQRKSAGRTPPPPLIRIAWIRIARSSSSPSLATKTHGGGSRQGARTYLPQPGSCHLHQVCQSLLFPSCCRLTARLRE